MGMAASQARLGSITARLHDVEYKAQNIQAQKIALSIDKDKIYQDYCDALDRTKIQVAYTSDTGSFNYVDANYDTVCTYQENRARNYALQDASTGQVYLNKEQADIYEMHKYAPYIQPIVEADDTIAEQKNIISQSKASLVTQENKIAQNQEILDDPDSSDAEKTAATNAITEANSEITTLNTTITTAEGKLAEATTARETAVTDYEDRFGNLPDDYRDMYDEYTSSTANWSEDESTYYDRLFQLVDENNYKLLDSQYTTGDAGYNWFNDMVESGSVILNEYVDTGSNQGWSDTDVTTSVNSNYLQEVDDETYVKKAEAEYEHALSLINQKDKRFDTELSKLETEEKSLTTEIESIEKVRDDNAERTFGIFG